MRAEIIPWMLQMPETSLRLDIWANELLLKSEDDDQPLYFAVTSMDGYGIESGATQENSRDFSKKLTAWVQPGCCAVMLKNVHLPEIAKKLDTNVFLVETLQGTAVEHLVSEHNLIDISRLSSGTYRLLQHQSAGCEAHVGNLLQEKKCRKIRKKLQKNLVESKNSSTFALAIQK